MTAYISSKTMILRKYVIIYHLKLWDFKDLLKWWKYDYIYPIKLIFMLQILTTFPISFGWHVPGDILSMLAIIIIISIIIHMLVISSPKSNSHCHTRPKHLSSYFTVSFLAAFFNSFIHFCHLTAVMRLTPLPFNIILIMLQMYVLQFLCC